MLYIKADMYFSKWGGTIELSDKESKCCKNNDQLKTIYKGRKWHMNLLINIYVKITIIYCLRVCTDELSYDFWWKVNKNGWPSLSTESLSTNVIIRKGAVNTIVFCFVDVSEIIHWKKQNKPRWINEWMNELHF